MHIGEAEIPALIGVDQSFMVDAEEMEDGRIEIVNVNGITCDGTWNGGVFSPNTGTFTSSPIQVTSISGTVVQASAGEYFTLYLKPDGTAWAAGQNCVTPTDHAERPWRAAPSEPPNATQTVVIERFPEAQSRPCPSQGGDRPPVLPVLEGCRNASW